MMDPAYANVAFSLQDQKKVSKIVESEFGFHIIQLIEKRGDRVNTRHILLRPKVSEKELTEACARLDSIADDIRANKFTFDDAAAVISQDKDTRNNHGIMVNINEHSGITTSKFQMQGRVPVNHLHVITKLRNLRHSVIIKIITINEQGFSLFHTHIADGQFELRPSL